MRYLNSLISSLISSIASGEIPEKFETLELNPQNSRKNSKLKRKTQFFGIFICWPRGKDGQTESLAYKITGPWPLFEKSHSVKCTYSVNTSKRSLTRTKLDKVS